MSGNPGPQYIMRSMQHCWQYRVAVLFFLSDHTRSCKIISTCRFCARFLQSRGSLCNIFMLIFRNTAYWDLSSAFEVRVVRQKNDSFWPPCRTATRSENLQNSIRCKLRFTL